MGRTWASTPRFQKLRQGRHPLLSKTESHREARRQSPSSRRPLSSYSHSQQPPPLLPVVGVPPHQMSIRFLLGVAIEPGGMEPLVFHMTDPGYTAPPAHNIPLQEYYNAAQPVRYGYFHNLILTRYCLLVRNLAVSGSVNGIGQ